MENLANRLYLLSSYVNLSEELAEPLKFDVLKKHIEKLEEALEALLPAKATA